MKSIKITQYQANDGRIFESEKDCKNYELFIEKSNLDKVNEYINNFLKDISNYNEGSKDYIIEYNDYYVCYDISKKFDKEGIYYIKMGTRNDIDRYIEIDEDFTIDYDKWSKFEKEFKEKFKGSLEIPYWYWSK